MIHTALRDRSVRSRFAVLVTLCAGLSVLFVAANASDAADPPQRMNRADAFLGIHFDFHAREDCTEVGKRTTPEMVELIIDKVHPDYIQIDCKGHPGYSSYPTKVGNPVPGFVGDPLKIWRDVTREHGVALFMHYSGVWDWHAVVAHPEWALRNADGKPDTNATSVFSPYVDELLIPQLRELAGEYGVDGVWIDGDCWGVKVDYGEKPVQEFLKKTGAKSVPRGPEDPLWNEWRDFHREAYRRYLRRYVNALKESHPDFQVISNWAFSMLIPEPVSADLVALSGDFSSIDSVNSARFAGRCLENQGRPWDLMSWSFDRNTRKQKPAIQLMQEAAIVLALGGGYQAYFKQDRDGAIRPAEMDVMAEVAKFCRTRQEYCHRSVAVPQIAMLFARAAHYRTSPRLFHTSGSAEINVLKSALTVMLEKQLSVQILSEHHLTGKMAQWPLIIIPQWAYLEESFHKELTDYVAQGGRLLLIGSGPAKLFETELANEDLAARIVSVPKVNGSFTEALQQLYPDPLVEVTGSADVDMTVRRLNDRLTIHLVNTSGPHVRAPEEGIKKVVPVGPLDIVIRLPNAPKSVTLQPEGKKLDVTYRDGRVQLTVPKLPIYSILVVEQ